MPRRHKVDGVLQETATARVGGFAEVLPNDGAGMAALGEDSVNHSRQRAQSKDNYGKPYQAAEEGNFFLRGFNYLFIMRKD